MGFSVERFREEDFPLVMRLENESFPLDAYSPEMMRERITTYPEGFIVAREGDAVVGYIAAWPVRGIARIDTMAVASGSRRRGVGSALLSEALEVLRQAGYESVELELRPDNTAALDLYYKFGFRDAGIKRGYYQSDGSDALLLKCSLI